MRHFDAHPYRTEDADGVWDFARGCMRTYLILADKARRFHEDPEIQEALRVAKVAELAEADRPVRRTRRAARRRRTTRTRSRHRATATSAWTNSSPSCCSGPASAPGRRGGLVHLRLQGPGPRRRHRRRRGVRPGRALPHLSAAERAATQRNGRRRSMPPARRPRVPAAQTPVRHCGRRATARARRPRRRRRGPAPRQALERHRVRSRHRDRSWPRCRVARPVGRRRAGAFPSRASPSPSCTGCAGASPRPSGSTATVLLPHDWLTFRLTGRRTTDRGDASGTGYWSPREEPLPRGPPAARQRRHRLDLRPARGARSGRRRRRVARRPGFRSLPGTGDNMAAALGLGLRPGDLALSLGTSGTAFTVERRPRGRSHGHRGRVRRRDRPLPAAGLHHERHQGHRRRGPPARRRSCPVRRAGARGAGRRGRAGAGAAPRRRADTEPAGCDAARSPACAPT